MYNVTIQEGEKFMKRFILYLSCAFLISTITVFADGEAFTPLNFNSSSYNNSYDNVVMPSSNSMDDEAIGNGNIQNAIAQLENAQIDIRNDLINLRTKFADVDAQYKLIKAERNSLKQQVRSIEKRIKEIDKAKERIRKNML